MRDSTGSIVIVAAAAALYYFMSRRDATKYYQGLRAFISDVGMGKDGFSVALHIQNPNSKGMIVQSVVGDFYLNNTKVGDISRFGTVNIGGNSESTLKLDIKPKIANIFDAVTNLVNHKAPIVAFFNGTVNINNEAVPVQIRYTVAA